MNSEASDYDVFISYARAGSIRDEQYVDHFIEAMTSIYRSRTGHDLRIFLDKKQIPLAEVWEGKIYAAMRRSSIMIPVLSPAYFASQWCGREWDTFMQMSRERSIIYGITPYLKLILPVTLRKWMLEDQGSPGTLRRVHEAKALQYVDFTDIPPGTEQFTALMTRLVDEVADVLTKLEEVAPGHSIWPDAVLTPASADSPSVNTRRAQDRFQFIRVLADAINVTIVGITNENLADFLSEALEVKRLRLGMNAFWESLHIVFLREELLDLVNDQLEAQRPKSRETSKDRKLRAKAGKRAIVSFLVRQDEPERWSLHEYNYYLPFLGVLFGMADGTNMVQITMTRPRHSVSDALYFELVDPADHYFANAFHDIVADSREENEIVLVGTPDDDSGFHVNGARFRRGALMEGQNTQEWLPSVVAATWMVRDGAKIPLLQVRTDRNAAHYIHHLSHVGGYINESDLVATDSTVNWRNASPVVLPPDAARIAARRELQDKLDLPIREDQLQLFSTCRFNNHDRENLFFYLFSLKVSSIHMFPEDSQIRGCKIADLLRLHLYQVSQKAEQMLRQDDFSSAQRVEAARILAWQFTLHGHKELGERVIRAARRPAGGLTGALQRLSQRHVIRWSISDQETTLQGLAEVHYREFFSTLLPLYAQVGVLDAEAVVARLDTVDGAHDALVGLGEAYRNYDLLTSLRFEV